MIFSNSKQSSKVLPLRKRGTKGDFYFLTDIQYAKIDDENNNIFAKCKYTANYK